MREGITLTLLHTFSYGVAFSGQHRLESYKAHAVLDDFLAGPELYSPVRFFTLCFGTFPWAVIITIEYLKKLTTLKNSHAFLYSWGPTVDVGGFCSTQSGRSVESEASRGRRWGPFSQQCKEHGKIWLRVENSLAGGMAGRAHARVRSEKDSVVILWARGVAHLTWAECSWVVILTMSWHDFRFDYGIFLPIEVLILHASDRG